MFGSLLVFLLVPLLGLNLAYAKFNCPQSSARVLVNNNSQYLLRMHTVDEHTCKLHLVADVKPFTKSKYFCLNHDYMVKVTTSHEKHRVAVSACDLWNDVEMNVNDGVFDVEFTHHRGDSILTGLTSPDKVDWQHHKHDQKKVNKKTKDYSTESLLD